MRLWQIELRWFWLFYENFMAFSPIFVCCFLHSSSFNDSKFLHMLIFLLLLIHYWLDLWIDATFSIYYCEMLVSVAEWSVKLPSYLDFMDTNMVWGAVVLQAMEWRVGDCERERMEWHRILRACISILQLESWYLSYKQCTWTTTKAMSS